MTRRLKNRAVAILGGMLYAVVSVLAGWLRRCSKDRWERVVDEARAARGAMATPIVRNAYRPNKSKGPESLSQSGSSGDVLRLLNGAEQLSGTHCSLPLWAREIQPFLLNQLSDHTRRAYETDLKHFFLFMEGRIDAGTLTQLRPEHIILYRKYLEEGRLTGKPLEKSTINRKLAVVKSFLNWLRLNSVIPENPAQLVKGFPQNQESALKGLSDEEARRMLEMPKTGSRSGALHAAILHTLLYMGLRKGELIGLKLGDVDEERGIPVLRVRGKGHRIRILPLTKSVKVHIDHYLWVCRRDLKDKEAPLFTPTKNPRTQNLSKPLNPNNITYIVLRYARKAGVLKKISPHSCRATCISNALDKKATHRSVQSLAGWSTPLMIQRYDKRREDLQNSAAFLIDYGEAVPTTTSSTATH